MVQHVLVANHVRHRKSDLKQATRIGSASWVIIIVIVTQSGWCLWINLRSCCSQVESLLGQTRCLVNSDDGCHRFCAFFLPLDLDTPVKCQGCKPANPEDCLTMSALRALCSNVSFNLPFFPQKQQDVCRNQHSTDGLGALEPIPLPRLLDSPKNQLGCQDEHHYTTCP